ncbi:MAG: AAA family ATPase [bacterium]
MIDSSDWLDLSERLQPLPWQGGVWKKFQGLVESNRLPHAVLLSGRAGVGKTHFARALIQGLLCSHSSGGIACGECRACQQFAAGNAPNLSIVAPEEEHKSIGIDQIRSMIDVLELSEDAGKGKFAVIHPAESMTVNAANSLLKTLEEPSGSTLMVLITASPSHLPATVLSRCRQVILPEVGEELAIQWLGEHGVKAPELPLLLSGGAPVRAMELAQSDELALFQDLVKSIGGLLVGRSAYANAVQVWQELDPHTLLDWLLILAERLSHRAMGLPVAQIAGLPILERFDALVPQLGQARPLSAYRGIIGIKSMYNTSMSKEVFLDNLIHVWMDSGAEISS